MKTKTTTTVKKAPRREVRGRDRRAEKRTERDNVLIVLLPYIFEKQIGVSA